MSAQACQEDGMHFAMAEAVVPLLLLGEPAQAALWLCFLYHMARLHGLLVASAVARCQEDIAAPPYVPSLTSKLDTQPCVHCAVHQLAKLQNRIVWRHGLAVHTLQNFAKKRSTGARFVWKNFATCHAWAVESYALTWLVSWWLLQILPKKGVPSVTNGHMRKKASV